MKIGYQGVEGSNSEEASKRFIEKMAIAQKVEFVPLTSSKRVVGELKRGNIDYGVMATRNTLGGTVKETFEAIKNEYLEFVGTEILHIHHSLFIKSDSDMSKITKIISHEQALKQTEKNRKKFYPNLREEPYADTALAAKALADGELGLDVAVLCRENAGERYQLKLERRNLEDEENNYTEFRIFKLSGIDYQNEVKPKLSEKIKYQLVNEDGIGRIGQFIMIISIFLIPFLSRYFILFSWGNEAFIGGYASVLLLFLSSNSARNKVRFNSLIGFWKYYSLSDSPDASEEQKFDVPRIVRIDEVDGELTMSGFICDKENVPFFETKRVLISRLNLRRGTLVYWYGNPQEMNRGIPLNGISELNWISKFPEAKINKMSGTYSGKTGKKDTGQIEFLRIGQEEFLAHRNSEFL